MKMTEATKIHMCCLNRWIYSYCHATQLRRKPSLKFPYVTTGSYLFFCSGDAANRGLLEVDTVFLVDTVAEWPERKGLPDLYGPHFENRQSDLWNRHFQFAFLRGHHEGRYTYVAKNWALNSEDYSFLPLNKTGERVSIRFTKLSTDLHWSIQVQTSRQEARSAKRESEERDPCGDCPSSLHQGR